MFKAFKSVIPPGAKNIYVMAESPRRKITWDSPTRCHAIFKALFDYLKRHFPSANVIIMRGQSVFADLARLTYARTVVCSVSTFCLWPSVASGGPKGSSTAGTKAYFPRSQLLAKNKRAILGSQPTMDQHANGFNWLPPLHVDGRQAKSMPIPKLVKILSA